MKDFDNYNVEEMNTTEMSSINGGSFLAWAVVMSNAPGCGWLQPFVGAYFSGYSDAAAACQ